MKKLIVLVAVMCLIASNAFAEWVSGYTRKNGTCVSPYYRTSANNTKLDNLSNW